MRPPTRALSRMSVTPPAGEIDIYRGTTQTRLLDRELAARLVRASR